MTGPLQGTRVIDMSRVLAGPWAGQLLADYGADVIKVEKPGSGDDTRHWGPPWLRDGDGHETQDAAYFLAANRNKRSITCNLAHEDGQQLIRDLVCESDVVLENYRVGTLQRYGLDADTLRGLNSALIYCSVSAYGQSGPRADEAGYDAMIQASAGLMSVTGEPAEGGGRPQKVGVAAADIMAGMYAVTAILAALVARGESGQGQAIDVPLFDSQVAWLANQGMNYLVGGSVPRRHGTAHPSIVPYQAFATADEELMLAVGNDAQFERCVDAMGLATLAQEPRFARNSARVENREELLAVIGRRLREESAAFWLNRFRDCNVPAGPINDLEAVFADPQVKERELVKFLTHPSAGSVPTIANPVCFSETGVEYRCAPPLLGQHTEEVLRDELGYSAKKIAALQAGGAI